MAHTQHSEHIFLYLSHIKTEDEVVDLENISHKHARTRDQEKELGHIPKQIIHTVFELFISTS